VYGDLSGDERDVGLSEVEDEDADEDWEWDAEGRGELHEPEGDAVTDGCY
jgi:hypothetical protein